jgi:prepilin-type N-terminal cleavage/methylation domain-containing protein
MRGFSLIEVLLVMALIGALAAVSAPVVSQFQSRNDLDTAVTMIVGSLRQAQAHAIAGDGDSTWGMRVGTNDVTLFRGTSYATRTTAWDTVAPWANTLAVSGTTEYVFTKTEGRTTAGSITLTTPDGVARTLTVNALGRIDY